jgi:threonine/homoserine/homoserine lactone efflux protein
MEFLGLTQTSHLWLYFVLVLGIIVLPGLDMAYVIGSSLTGGRTSGLAAVAGITVGGMFHTLMGVIGIGALLQLFPAAFNIVLLAGTVYLGWIGWSLMRGATGLSDIAAVAPTSLATTFGRAVMTCLLNPKAYLFMFAVMPQFVRPEHGAIAVQAIAIGLITAACQIVVYGAFSFGAIGLRHSLRGNQDAQIRLVQAVGAILIVAAAWTAFRGWR